MYTLCLKCFGQNNVFEDNLVVATISSFFSLVSSSPLCE